MMGWMLFDALLVLANMYCLFVSAKRHQTGIALLCFVGALCSLLSLGIDYTKYVGQSTRDQSVESKRAVATTKVDQSTTREAQR